MIGSVDLSPAHRAIVERILKEHVQQCEVRAFGSRVAWTAKDFSDLDLAVVGVGPLDWRNLARLKEAFEESRLPMRVDVLDWHAISECFRKVIERDYVVVQDPATQTTAGGWRTALWGELATLEYGKSLRDYDSPAGPYRVYGTNGPIGWNSEPLCPYASVIIGRKGAYRGVHYSPDPFFVIDTAFYLKPKLKLDTRWAYYQLLTQDINSMDSGSAIPSTSREDFYGLPVQVPPISEQRAIAHVLGTLDDKIELNRRMNETLEEMARALFKSWFVDFEPVRAKAALKQHALGNRAGPGAAPSGNSAAPAGEWTVDRARVYLDAMDPPVVDLFPDRLLDSELGEIPEGWEVRSLDDIAAFTNGLALQRYPPEGDDWLPVIKIAEMRRGYTDKTGRASAQLDPRYVVEDGDLLFSWSGSLELVFWTHGRGALNQHLFKVTSDEFPRWFYWGWIREHLADFRAIAAGKATTMGHIQRHHLTDAKVPVPPPNVVAAGGTFIGALVDQHVGHALQSRALVTQRDALLPRLMSGEIGVKEVQSE